jgi:DNA-binding response OmpR family regulator
MGISGRILIIDDEASLRHTLARILQRAGIQATTAASGQEALFLLSQQSFDLVYLDVRMPDMNGLETLKSIHAQLPDMPVVLFTAQPDVSSAVEALRLGAEDYLVKPIQPQILIDRTQSILAWQERKRRKREIQQQIEALQMKLNSLENDEELHPEPSFVPFTSNERYLTRGKLSLDLHTHSLTIDGKTVNLPPTAFDYLLVLVRHTPNVVDFQTLVAEAQGCQAEFREAQELAKWHIHQIRQAIEPEARKPRYLINVRGTGYRLIAD